MATSPGDQFSDFFAPEKRIILDQTLATLWRWRMNQQVVECKNLLDELLSRFPLAQDQLSEESFRSLPREDQFRLCRLILLLASMARGDGKRESSKRLVKIVSNYVEVSGVSAPFQLPFQQGLNSMVDADYSTALESFLFARIRADSKADEACALSNIIYCLENLGLSFSNALGDLGKVLAKVPSGELSNARALLQAMEFRGAFHRGDIRFIVDAGALEHSHLTQADHYRFWVAKLPYHRYYNLYGESEIERYLLSNPFLFEKSYRIRTLQGILHPGDLVNFRVKERPEHRVLSH